jgi:hypothetical protein
MYLKYSYKFETLVPFRVIPLSLDTAIPALLLLLETLSKILQWKFCPGPPASLIGPLQCHQNASSSIPASSENKKKWLQGARSGTLVGWGTTTVLFLAKNCWMLKSVWAGGIVMVQEPIPTLPLFWPFSLQALNAIISTHST